MSIFAPPFETLEEVYFKELRELYSAEQQLLEVLPKMADAATDLMLKNALRAHWAETQIHKARLREIFSALEDEPAGAICRGMERLIKAACEYTKSGGAPELRDAALIGAARRIEQHEIAGYGSARAMAKRLGETRAADLLEQTLEEEDVADQKLTSLAGNSAQTHAANG